MASVELQQSLTVPAVPARSALSSILHDIADYRGDWAEFALYLNFGSLGLPDVGYAAIPVTISGLHETTEPRHEIRFHLQSRRSPDVFPTFDGAMGVDATGASSSLMWLAGNYEVPLKGFGTFVDLTLAHGAAEKCLNNMLGELAAATVSRVEQREYANARYRLIFNTGD